MTEQQHHTRQLRAIMRKAKQPAWHQLAGVQARGFHPHKSQLAQSRKSKLVKRGRRSA